MYRKIMNFLETWKNSEHRKPLILQGQDRLARRIPFWNLGAHTMKHTRFQYKLIKKGGREKDCSSLCSILYLKHV